MISRENFFYLLKKYFWVFFLIGFTIYFPILSNGFVWDDNPFIVNNPEVHQINLNTLLGNNMFNSGPFYRPVPAIYFAITYSLFQNQAILYHLTQLTLHLICTSLLFLFFCSFFKKNIAFFLSLIFLIHPINVESVAYIGSTQSELYFLSGISALILAQTHSLSKIKFLSIIGLLFICIMTKETGFIFLLLVIIYSYFFKPGKTKQFIFSAAAIIGVYALLRIFIGGVTYKMEDYIPIATLSLFDRILNIPAIFFYYLKTFIFPLNLAVWQTSVIKSLTLQNFILPLIISGTFLIMLLLITYFFYKKEAEQKQNIPANKQIKHNKQQKTEKESHSKQFIFFLIWFLLGIGMLLQVVPLDMTVADRWFYFPIVGLLGIIGVCLQEYWTTINLHNKIFITILVIIISILSLRTFIRTLDWKDNVTLYMHDAKTATDNHLMLLDLANQLYYKKRYKEALAYAKQSVAIHPWLANLVALGLNYQKTNQYEKAAEAYKEAIKYYKLAPESNTKPPPGMVTTKDKFLEQAYVSLASTYLLMNRSEDAIKLINEEGLKKFPDDPRLYYFLALAENQMGNRQKALDAIIKSNELLPNKISQDIIFRLKNNLPINLSSQYKI